MDPQKVKDYYQEIQKVIDQVGYAIQGVFPNEEGICVCYTIGLAPLLGAECIVAGQISLQTLYQTLRSNIDELIKDKEQLSEKEFVGGTLLNGEDLRCKYVDVSNKHHLKNFMTVRVNEVNKVFQMYLADKNNILPDEDGYDISFDQEVK